MEMLVQEKRKVQEVVEMEASLHHKKTASSEHMFFSLMISHSFPQTTPLGDMTCLAFVEDVARCGCDGCHVSTNEEGRRGKEGSQSK